MAIKVGITGGIGSGKSTVCRIFKLLGAPVFEADKEAKDLLLSDSAIKEQLINLYGNDIYVSNGAIDRKKLAAIIFNNKIELERVNNIVHPAVRSKYSEWSQKQDYEYTIHEAAILFESGFYKMMDFSILVSAPKNIRIERILNRDNASVKQIEERMANQWEDDLKRELASVELVNDDTKLLIPQIIKIDKQLREHGKIW